jgi:hypothetical protein
MADLRKQSRLFSAQRYRVSNKLPHRQTIQSGEDRRLLFISNAVGIGVNAWVLHLYILCTSGRNNLPEIKLCQMKTRWCLKLNVICFYGSI